MTAFLQSGCALILGSVGADGAPCASRGWGLDVLADPGWVRLLLDATHRTTADHLAAGGALAITAASVRTLRSVQLKGHALGVEPVTAADEERAARYCEAMFTDIYETKSTPMEVIEQIRPTSFLACTAVVDEVFDQTPGPHAGRPITVR